MFYLIILMITCCSVGCNSEKTLSKTADNTEALVNQNASIPITSFPTSSPDKSVFRSVDGVILFKWDKDAVDSKKGLIHLYDEAGRIWNEINFYNDRRDSMSVPVEEFQPLYFRASDFGLQMRCTGKSDEWYEVIVNENNPSVKKYIRTGDSLFEFQHWDKYIMKMLNITFEQNTNPLLDSPNGKKKNIQLKKDAVFAPIDVKGDWVKVRLKPSVQSDTSAVRNEKKKRYEEGWIRWRNDQHRIIIDDYYP